MTGTEQELRTPSIALFALLIVFGAGAGLLCVETGVRVYDRIHRGTPLLLNRPRGALRDDARLGWAPRELYRNAHGQLTHSGSQYVVHFSQNSSGMRVCDGPATGRTMLVVGDSFTEAWEAGENRQYYCIAAQAIGARAEGFGAGGYGSLQERMVLDTLLSKEQPDLVIVQVCFNDFINNDFDLEKASWQNNHSMTRPFWRSGRIELLLPGHFPLWFEEARLHSRLASTLYDGMLNRSAATAHSVEEDIEKTGAAHPGFEAAASETGEVFGQIRQLLKGHELAAFATDLKEPYLSGFRRIFVNLDIPFIEDGAAAVAGASAQGVDVFANDGVHWNETGHRIAGEALAQAIQTRFPR